MTTQAYESWLYRRKVNIDTSATGADINTDQANFPFLVRLVEPEFHFSQTQVGGRDLRFADSNGTPLSYQIERWDIVNGKADVWVRVPVVHAPDSTQFIHMYWGKTQQQLTDSSGPDTFQASNAFEAVWHLNEVGNNDAGGYADATSHAHNATGHNMQGDDRTEGMVGYGNTFNGVNKYLSVPGGAGAIDLANKSFTISVWAKRSSTGSNNWIIGQGTNATRQGLHFGHRSYNRPSFAFWGDDLDGSVNASTGWLYMVATYDAGANLQKLYIDGTFDGSRATGGEFVGSGEFQIGKRYFGGDYPFAGILDELRVSTVARSEDWIKLCCQSQKEDQNVVSFGPVESVGGVHFHGPCPWADVQAFGASTLQTTGTIDILVDPYKLTLAAPMDFQDGQLIHALGAGPDGKSLITNIDSGGGTTTLILHDPAARSLLPQQPGLVLHDVTDSLQAAIDSLPEEGGLVFFPVGTYCISFGLKIRTAVQLIGSGNGHIRHEPFTGSVIFVDNPDINDVIAVQTDFAIIMDQLDHVEPDGNDYFRVYYEPAVGLSEVEPGRFAYKDWAEVNGELTVLDYPITDVQPAQHYIKCALSGNPMPTGSEGAEIFLLDGVVGISVRNLTFRSNQEDVVNKQYAHTALKVWGAIECLLEDVFVRGFEYGIQINRWTNTLIDCATIYCRRGIDLYSESDGVKQCNASTLYGCHVALCSEIGVRIRGMGNALIGCTVELNNAPRNPVNIASVSGSQSPWVVTLSSGSALDIIRMNDTLFDAAERRYRIRSINTGDRTITVDDYYGEKHLPQRDWARSSHSRALMPWV